MLKHGLFLVVFLSVFARYARSAEDALWKEKDAEGAKAFQAGRFDEAEALWSESLKLAEKFGAKDSRLATSLYHLGSVYSEMGRYPQAEALLKRSLAISEEVRGAESLETADIIRNLAGVYAHLAKYETAESLYRRVLAIFEKTRGLQHPDVADILMGMADLYYQQEKLPEALAHAQRGLAIAEKVLGREHPSVAMLVTIVGNVLLAQGQYVKAQPYFERALEIREKAFGGAHPLVAQSLANLAQFELTLGKSQAALTHFERAVGIFEKAMGAEHPLLAHMLDPMAVIHRENGALEKAEALARRSLQIQEKALGKEHPALSLALHALAAVRFEQGQVAEAEELWKRALDISEGALGANHPLVAIGLHNLAQVFEAQLKFKEALPLLTRAAAILEAAYGPDELMTARVRCDQAIVQAALGQRASALADLAREISRLVKVREQVFTLLSENGKQVWLDNLIENWHVLFVLARNVQAEDPRAAAIALDAALHYQGAVFGALTDEQEAAYSADDPALGRLAKELHQTRRALAERLLKGAAGGGREARHPETVGLEKRLEELETELALKSAPFANVRRMRQANTKTVAAALPKDAVWISYLRYRDFDLPKNVWDGWRYLALTLKAGGVPALFDLGPAIPIEQAVQALRQESIEAERQIARKGEAKAERAWSDKARAVSDLLLRPLTKEIAGSPRWIVAPDGPLSTLPFGLLPEPDSDSWVIERHEVSNVVSGREIVAWDRGAAAPKPPPASVGALLIADPDFDLEVAAGTSAEKANPPVSLSARWPRLAATREEATALARLFEAQKIPVTMRLDREATKSALLAAPAPRFLHLATHGFYLPDSDPRGQQEAPGRRSLLEPAALAGGPSSASPLARFARIENPMLRAGLVFSGANSKAGGLSGVATAQELLGLNLWGTELVVLSACETGAGEGTTGEGVLGLRRSFLASGARTLVSSLWKIPDQETRDLMQGFYRRRLGGERVGAALRAAMLEIRERRRKAGGAAHPFFWGSFVLSGDGG